MNLEIEKRKGQTKDRNFKKHYSFRILVFAFCLTFSYPIGYRNQGNEIQAKEILLRSLKVQIFDEKTRLQQTMYEI